MVFSGQVNFRKTGTTPAVLQQGTFAPDSNYRWMGSIAMDHSGNIVLGYSASVTAAGEASITLGSSTPVFQRPNSSAA
jgi:hypothetical protein